LQGLASASAEELLDVPGVGDTTAQSIQGWFKVPSNLDISLELAGIWNRPKSAGNTIARQTHRQQATSSLQEVQEVEEAGWKFQLGSVTLRRGDKLVVTGSIEGLVRSDIERWYAATFLPARPQAKPCLPQASRNILGYLDIVSPLEQPNARRSVHSPCVTIAAKTAHVSRFEVQKDGARSPGNVSALCFDPELT
jgi:hypothetical protein